MYDEITDYDLLDKVSDNEDATEALFEKYQPLIKNLAKKAYYKNLTSGLDLNDLIQEGMVGFSIALNTFDENKETSFFTFARMCIARKITSTLISANRQKNQVLNESISVEKISEDETIKDRIFTDDTSNPENMLLDYENTKELENKIKKELTSFENEVFELKKAGLDYKEISELLDKEPKSIDNAINRIKTKINKYLENVK